MGVFLGLDLVSEVRVKAGHTGMKEALGFSHWLVTDQDSRVGSQQSQHTFKGKFFFPIAKQELYFL